MDDQAILAALQRHWAASDANDFEAEHDIYREDAVLDYPQSGERIRGRRNIQESRFVQPNKKRFTVRRIVGGGDLWVSEFVLTYDGVPSYVVSIMEFREGLVAHETQYFGEKFDPVTVARASCRAREVSMRVKRRSRAPDAAQRLFGGALLSRGPYCGGMRGLLGPGSAQQREGRCSASGTRRDAHYWLTRSTDTEPDAAAGRSLVALIPAHPSLCLERTRIRAPLARTPTMSAKPRDVG